MFMNIRVIITVLILLLTIPAQAQRRKVQRPKISPEEQKRMEKLERMRAATEKVMIIDSMVVNKEDFLKHYKLSQETGSIKDGDDFFHSKNNDGLFVYLNELGNKCYFSLQETDSTSNLYYAEAINTEWSQPVKLEGINDEQQFQKVNYPYMMGDGSTFYFAATGDEEGLGGYDIYMTTYDSEENRFLRPVNIGMPFNSEANDYLYVIDEYANLGWFATDRNQEEGKVCIYVFVPSATRHNYDSEEYTPEEISSFARIDCIANTWDDEDAYHQALQRLEEVKMQKPQQANRNTITFVINDDITYHQLSDFQEPHNVMRYQQLVNLRKRQNNLNQALDKIREVYASASSKEREAMNQEILSGEQEALLLAREAHDLEKAIRNAENLFLTKYK